jgi:hypothetical protein
MSVSTTVFVNNWEDSLRSLKSENEASNAASCPELGSGADDDDVDDARVDAVVEDICRTLAAQSGSDVIDCNDHLNLYHQIMAELSMQQESIR